MKMRGFTVVELAVVIVIMAVLLTLSIVGIRGSTANARDDERNVDTEIIARHLERYYTSGYEGFAANGTYPSTGNLFASGSTSIMTILEDIIPESITAPRLDEGTVSLIAATNAVETTSGVTPQPTIDEYVYQPIASNSTSLCTTGTSCRRFNLYYMTEVDSTIRIIESIHQ